MMDLKRDLAEKKTMRKTYTPNSDSQKTVLKALKKRRNLMKKGVGTRMRVDSYLVFNFWIRRIRCMKDEYPLIFILIDDLTV